MKIKCFYSFIILVLIYSCNNLSSPDKNISRADSSKSMPENYRNPKNYLTDCKLLYLEAAKMDSILFQQTEMNIATGKSAIKAFTDYAYYCPNDSLTTVFLIKTAQIATSMNNVPQAKTALDKCITSYPKSKDITVAMFLLARLYDEQAYLNNEEEARRLYQEIIDKYPKCAEAESAKGAIRFIGKSDEEMMKEIKKQNKKKSK